MVRLRVLDILKEQNHSKYWLYKQMELSYQNFNRMVQNETSSIKFENLEKLCSILNCSIGDLSWNVFPHTFKLAATFILPVLLPAKACSMYRRPDT